MISRQQCPDGDVRSDVKGRDTHLGRSRIVRGKFSGGFECFGAGFWGDVWRRMHKHEKECNWMIRVKGSNWVIRVTGMRNAHLEN